MPESSLLSNFYLVTDLIRSNWNAGTCAKGSENILFHFLLPLDLSSIHQKFCSTRSAHFLFLSSLVPFIFFFSLITPNFLCHSFLARTPFFLRTLQTRCTTVMTNFRNSYFWQGKTHKPSKK